jgi:hypothetical protein
MEVKAVLSIAYSNQKLPNVGKVVNEWKQNGQT